MGLIKKRARRLVRQKIRKPAHAALHRAAEHWCPECQKNVQPFHLCAPKSDFKRRKARHERGRRPGRKTGSGKRAAHDYAACTDKCCKNPLCKAFREGQQACPLPHQ